MQPLSPPAPFFIEQVEQDQWIPPKRWADWPELILVQTGEGCHAVNGNPFAYRSGDVFFLGAQDQYSFAIAQRTSFCRLSFSPFFVDSLPARHAWGYLDGGASPCLGPIATDAADQEKLRALVGMLLAEEPGLRPCTDNFVVESLLTVILSLVGRLLTRTALAPSTRLTHSVDLTRRVIAYITRHIGEPHRLRLETLADAFNYSPGHLSALFKEQAGDSIQHYIIRHKLNLVARRLRQTSLTVSQVADEFGFTDVCHLNKLFKRHYKRTPTTYRQSVWL
ncbi:helix-turn-helix domain-containing protein [Tellurirhabdus rosea]|uniref:helix-turn-helix domain-containing protein n=1 Tax=Tellurirhabdus rosea TaxID=2674997 RepID=UPI00225A5D53|nr:AraC family transcriptional regulator [Tellurirhabdus rosea]